MSTRNFKMTTAVWLTVSYSSMQNGPTYLAKMTLDYPEAGVQLIVENFDYMRQQ